MHTTALEAAKSIAPFVEKAWPNDRDQLFNILTLINEKIWENGYFPNMTKWFYARVRQDNTIITPHGYSIMLGANIGKHKVQVRDELFMFHENGPLLEPNESSTYSKRNIQFVGEFPTIVGHLPMMQKQSSCFKLGVMAPDIPPMRSPATTIVSCHNSKGRPIYSYEFDSEYKTIDDEDAMQAYTPDDIESSGIIEGIKFAIGNKMVIYDNVIISDIYRITKEPTLARVEYYLVDEEDGVATLAASLEPFQIVSKYNVYRIQEPCFDKGYCLGLFKMSKPDPIINETQVVLTSSMSGIIDMAKGIYQKNSKDNINAGAAFIASGMASVFNELSQMQHAPSTLQFKSKSLSAAKKFKGWKR